MEALRLEALHTRYSSFILASLVPHLARLATIGTMAASGNSVRLTKLIDSFTTLQQAFEDYKEKADKKIYILATLLEKETARTNELEERIKFLEEDLGVELDEQDPLKEGEDVNNEGEQEVSSCSSSLVFYLLIVDSLLPPPSYSVFILSLYVCGRVSRLYLPSLFAAFLSCSPRLTFENTVLTNLPTEEGI
ncbi:hypothetical protein BDQ17DRAFT_1433858 [Cyathus striatus]|nr:hypothetical protein BDQ17DRAFT_1433858 [Cyathus striatus]